MESETCTSIIILYRLNITSVHSKGGGGGGGV